MLLNLKNFECLGKIFYYLLCWGVGISLSSCFLQVQQFSSKTTDTSLRVASLEYLGIVAARLRKDAVTSHLNQDVIDDIVQKVRYLVCSFVNLDFILIVYQIDTKTNKKLHFPQKIKNHIPSCEISVECISFSRQIKHCF